MIHQDEWEQVTSILQKPSTVRAESGYQDTFHRLCQADAENIKLIQRVHVLERDLQSQALTEQAIYDLDSAELLRFAREHAALVRAMVAELRVRHVDLPDELWDL